MQHKHKYYFPEKSHLDTEQETLDTTSNMTPCPVKMLQRVTSQDIATCLDPNEI